MWNIKNKEIKHKSVLSELSEFNFLLIDIVNQETGWILEVSSALLSNDMHAWLIDNFKLFWSCKSFYPLKVD